MKPYAQSSRSDGRRSDATRVAASARNHRREGTDLAREEVAGFRDRIMIKERGRVFFVELDQIRFIQSDGNYVRIYVGDDYHLARGTMAEVMEHLDSRRFVRIHRSTIAHVGWIQELRPDHQGRYEVILKDGTELVLSRTYRDEVLSRAL